MESNWIRTTVLLALLLTILMSPAPSSVVAQEPIIVPKEKATLAAQAHIDAEVRKGTIPAWEDATPTDPVTYHNPDGSVAVYVFSVTGEQRDLGFVTLSAYKHPVVLEFSTAPAPHKLMPDAALATARQAGLELDTVHPVFLGPLWYVYQTIGTGEKELVFVTLDGMRALRPSTNELAEMVRAWHRFVDSSIDQTMSIALVEPQASKTLNVEIVRQGCNTTQPCNCSFCGVCTADAACVPWGYPPGRCWVGCHPAAGASIMRYWNDRGYPGLGTNADTIMVDLHYHMNTNECGATTRPNSTAGIESYTASKGHTFDATCYSTHLGCSGQPPSFQQLVTEIDAGRPPIVAFNGHAYTGIGYDTNGQIAILNSNLGNDPRRVSWSLIASYTGNLAAGIITIHPPAPNQPPNPPSLSNPANGTWLTNRTVTLSWRDGGDPDNKPNSFRDYNVVVWDNTGWSTQQGWPVGVFYTATSWELTVPRDGIYYWHVRAGDGDLASGWSETHSFGVDTTAPSNPTAANSGCNAQNSIWQNTCNDPNFSWSGAADATSGVAGYQVYWGSDPNGTSAFWTTSPGYNPSAVSTGTYYLRVRTKDNAGNWNSWTTLFTFRYDNLAPSGSFSFSGGELSYAINTLLNLNGTDVGSGVRKVRLSNNGTDWTEREYAQQVHWTIPATDGQRHTVYLRFVDAAGNVSPVCQQQVCLDLTPPMPSSANYRLWPAGQIAGGGYTSASYRLYHTEGQPFAHNPQTGSHYRLHSGFQATWPSSPGAKLFTADGCAATSGGGLKVYLPIITKNQ
jgi:hypothetical protein